MDIDFLYEKVNISKINFYFLANRKRSETFFQKTVETQMIFFLFEFIRSDDYLNNSPGFFQPNFNLFLNSGFERHFLSDFFYSSATVYHLTFFLSYFVKLRKKPKKYIDIQLLPFFALKSVKCILIFILSCTLEFHSKVDRHKLNQI